MNGQSGNAAKTQGSLTVSQRLLEVAVKNHVSAKNVEHLLRSVDFHSSLRGFVRRIRNLNRILSIKIDGWSPVSELPDLGSWQAFITCVLVDPRGFSQSMRLSVQDANEFLDEDGIDPDCNIRSD
jgi:hypothetical protein